MLGNDLATSFMAFSIVLVLYMVIPPEIEFIKILSKYDQNSNPMQIWSQIHSARYMLKGSGVPENEESYYNNCFKALKWLNDKDPRPTSEPLMAWVSIDGQEACVSLLDEGVEHRVLLRETVGV